MNSLFAVDEVKDQIYASNGRDLLADLYLPRNNAASRPAIIWLHGGGWRFGSRHLAPDLRRFYAQRGFVMVAIDYRLSKEAHFPAALEDVKTAIRWVKSIAPRYRIDPARIALLGSSAGGHLGALAALTGDKFSGAGFGEYPNGVAAVVDAYGPSDFLQLDAHRDPDGKPSDDPESIQLSVGRLSADPDSLESLFVGAAIETVPERVHAANPVSYVHADAPPFLILHGLSDTAVPAHQSVLLFEALRAAEARARLVLIDGLGHGFLNRNALDDHTWSAEIREGDETGRREIRIFELIGAWLGEQFSEAP